MKRLRVTLLAAVLVLPAMGAAPAKQADLPPHLRLAQKMVAEIKPENNRYKSGKYVVTWAGLKGANLTKNESDCTTYVTALLGTAYNLTAADFISWAGVASPSIGRYYDAATENKGLHGFKKIKDLKPGDLLISKYVDPKKGSAAGHMMMVETAPVATQAGGTKDDSSLQAYDITILDCTSSPHAKDSRSKKNAPDGQNETGIGRGTMQVYVDANGDVAEWSWSAGNRMIRYGADKRPLIFAKIPAAESRR